VSEWQPIETAPSGTWLRTKREGEPYYNISMYRECIGEEWEWIDLGGRTTVTHRTFLPPTHWMPLPEPPTAAPHTAAAPADTAQDQPLAPRQS